MGLREVPRIAGYLAGRFKDGGFPADDVHILDLGETASLVVRYRGAGTELAGRALNKGKSADGLSGTWPTGRN